MNVKSTDKVTYYTEYKGHDNKRHYAVNRYDRVSGMVDYVTDHLFHNTTTTTTTTINKKGN